MGSDQLKRTGKYKLADMLAKSDPRAPLSEEERAWEQIPPIGAERFWEAETIQNLQGTLGKPDEPVSIQKMN